MSLTLPRENCRGSWIRKRPKLRTFRRSPWTRRPSIKCTPKTRWPQTSCRKASKASARPLKILSSCWPSGWLRSNHARPSVQTESPLSTSNKGGPPAAFSFSTRLGKDQFLRRKHRPDYQRHTKADQYTLQQKPGIVAPSQDRKADGGGKVVALRHDCPAPLRPPSMPWDTCVQTPPQARHALPVGAIWLALLREKVGLLGQNETKKEDHLRQEKENG